MPPSLCSAVMGESSPTTLLVRAANSLSDVECSPFLCTCEVPLSFLPNTIMLEGFTLNCSRVRLKAPLLHRVRPEKCIFYFYGNCCREKVCES